MISLLKSFEEKSPEIIFEWSDKETDAKGWVVINSLRGGAAGGGTRMREGLDKEEVIALAKTMEVKFTISGPSIGGAKSGINFDPNHPKKKEVLERWFQAIYPLLKHYYGTGGDLNVHEVNEVIDITEDFGLWHPQEGIVNGFFRPTEPQKIKKLGQLRQGVSKIIEDSNFSPSLSKKYRISNMITGYGVAEAVKHYYHFWGGNIKNKKAIVQGWGNVGASAGFFLSKMGVRIVAITDKAGGLINEAGFSQDEICQLFLNRNGNEINHEDLLSREELDERIWSSGAEIFVPAAASRLVTDSQFNIMLQNGLEVISSGANVPFREDPIFYGPITSIIDKKVSLIPDFIANCGMARVFAYLMQDDVAMTDESIFSDTSAVIFEALQKIHQMHPDRINIAERALQIALEQLT